MPPADLFALRARAQEAFAFKTYQDEAGHVLNYRLYVPADLSGDIPLLLFFHGAGERGADNERQLFHSVPSILAYLEKRNLPAIVIAPQCPEGQQWVDVPWSDDEHTMPESPSAAMTLVIALLQQSLREFPIDLSRVYVSGISMGGFGTWDILQRHPELFAAALPVCGGGDIAQASRIKHVPIRTFHGSIDTVVKPIRSRAMVAALHANGGSPHYMEYKDVAHDSWTETYANDEVLDWLFAQQR